MRPNLCLLFCVLFFGCSRSIPDASTPPIGFWREVGTHNYFGTVQTSIHLGEDHSYASENEMIMKSSSQTVLGVHYFDAWRMHDGTMELQMPAGVGLQPGWSTAPFKWIDRDHIELRGLKYERTDHMKSQE